MFTSAVQAQVVCFGKCYSIFLLTRTRKHYFIDLDLRKPVQHTILAMERSPGFSDFIAKDMPFSDAVRSTKMKISFMSAGSRSANPSELLTTSNLKKLLKTIPEDFDRIVFDTSPLIPVRDALPVSKLVDSSVILYRMGATHRKAISRTLKILNENNADPVGIVANGLPPMKKSSGYYGYYGNYYYGNYAYSYYGSGSYYGEEEDEENPS